MHPTIEWLPENGAAEQLILLLHARGSSGAAMAPLAQALRGAFAQAAVLAPDAPQAHGEDDTVAPAASARLALHQLAALQGDATLDIAAGVGHALHPALIDRALHRLTTHIPMRTWQAALGAAGAAPP